jgi:hypothetical protein
MLIKELNRFVKQAAFLPLFFWVYDYYSAQKSFVMQLELIKKSVNNSTVAGRRIAVLLEVMKKPKLDEIELAKELEGLTEVFRLSDMEGPELKEYEELVGKFVKRVQQFDSYKSQRDKINQEKNPEQIKATDFKHIQGVGIGYVLEYYLAIYKILQEKKTDQEKLDFINTKEINLGFGGLPGLRQDFEQDESLNKFILLILDDNLREELLRNYYWIKIQFMENPNDLLKIEQALKQWIAVLLKEFEKVGVVSLTSIFFKPYGEKPKIKELLEVFGK